MKKLLITLLVTVLALPALANGLTDMSAAERKAFRAEVRAYLLDNPEVLMEAIGVLEKRQKAEQAQSEGDMIAANAKEIFNDGVSWETGNPNGDITMVEFTDYRCPYCRKAHQEIRDLVRKDGNIRLVVKEFPILGQDSVISSRMAIATLKKAGPEAYGKLADFLITFNGKMTEKTQAAILKKFNLNADEIMAYMKDPAVDAQIAAVHALAGKLQISGTPTFVLPDRMIRGYAPPATMRAIIRQSRKNNK